MPEDAPEKKPEPVPEWGVRVMQAAIRAYRYTGEYVRGTDEQKVYLAIRRGTDYAGVVELSHYTMGGTHFLRLQFQPMEKEKKPTTFLAKSLDQLKQYAVRLMEAVCEYGGRRRGDWCAQCSQSERHMQGEYGPPPENPLAPG